MPTADGVLEVDGRRVGYRVSGADARPNLLFLHGMPGSRAELGDYEPTILEQLDASIKAAVTLRRGQPASSRLRCSPKFRTQASREAAGDK
jgi:hypothetical protein